MLDFLNKEIGKLTTSLTDTVTGKAKDSAIATLNDPEFKASVNKFTKDWIDEHRVIISAIVGSFVFFSILALMNIISNARATR